MVYSGAGVGVEVTEVEGMDIGLGKSVMSVMFGKDIIHTSL